MTKTRCERHGLTEATFVCDHIAQGLVRRERTGFFWSAAETGNPYPDAWCLACEQRRQAAGGEWVGAAAENLRARILCANCYLIARTFHMGGPLEG